MAGVVAIAVQSDPKLQVCICCVVVESVTFGSALSSELSLFAQEICSYHEMFILVEVVDDVPIAPCDLAGWKSTREDPIRSQDELSYQRLMLHEKVTTALNMQYADKVIPDVGLGICVHSISNVGDGHIYRSDNRYFMSQVNFRVTFQLVVFMPEEGTLLEGVVSEAGIKGLNISMQFFDNIHVPQPLMQQLSRYLPTEEKWVWEYQNDDGTVNLLDYEVGERIRVVVQSVSFASDEEIRAQPDMPPMSIVARANAAGLGHMLWWADEEDDRPGEEAAESDAD